MMPLAEIESVLHVSSEDPLNPAKNLITSAIGSNVKKWLCLKKGDKNVYVIFKLKQKANITNITVGNENTAIIEILVGNENTQEKDYQVLLPTTELQTIQDVRTGRNKNSVHFFTTKDFNKDVAGCEWERLKIVCSQPYDSHIRYGLSCFVIKSIKDENDCSVKEKVKNGENKKTNELTEAKKSELNEWKEDVLQRLGPGVSSSSSGNSSFKRKENANNITSPFKQRKLDHKIDEAGSSSEITIKTEINTKNNMKDNGRSEKRKDIKQSTPSKNKFSKLFDGVRFSMSGYENPLRSELRSKALEMGAKYSADWDSRCTHLICAFMNTPKFNQVRSQGNGKIVTKDWIEICYGKRRRLPWRRFALDQRERQLPESEEDEEEDVAKTQNPRKKEVDRRRRLPSSSSASSSDTEDEIEKIQARRKAINLKENKKLSIKKEEVSKNKDLEKLYNADTDESEQGDNEMNITGRRPDTSDLPLPRLPDFPSHNYFICKDEKGEYRHQLERYIHAFQGEKKPNRPVPPIPHIFGKHKFFIGSDISGVKRERLKNYIDSFQWNIFEDLSPDVEFAITDDVEVAKEIINKYPKIQAVKSDWIWKCSDEDSLVSPENFLIKL